MKSRLPISVIILAMLGAAFWLLNRQKPSSSPAPQPTATSEIAPPVPGKPAIVLSSQETPSLSKPSVGPLPDSPQGSPPSAGSTVSVAPPINPVAPQAPGIAPLMPAVVGESALTAPSGVEYSQEKIMADLEKLSLSLRDYRTVMAQNPIGTNAEITKALTGGNPKGARLAPEDSTVNGNGEMVDRWGTPYFFHQMSGTSMEIHSAGPDRKLGTDDDIIQR